MDLSRAIYSRDLKVTVMRALDAGAARGELARKYQLSPKLLERWRSEWRAQGEMAFPGIGRRKLEVATDEGRHVDCGLCFCGTPRWPQCSGGNGNRAGERRILVMNKI